MLETNIKTCVNCMTYNHSQYITDTMKGFAMQETDSPYMAPEPNRGKRNDSRNIKYVAEKLAQIKGLDTQEVIDVTNQNARKLLFGE